MARAPSAASGGGAKPDSSVSALPATACPERLSASSSVVIACSRSTGGSSRRPGSLSARRG